MKYQYAQERIGRRRPVLWTSRQAVALLLVAVAIGVSVLAAGCSESAREDQASELEGSDEPSDLHADLPELDVPDSDACSLAPGSKPRVYERYGYAFALPADSVVDEQSRGTVFGNQSVGGYIMPLYDYEPDWPLAPNIFFRHLGNSEKEISDVVATDYTFIFDHDFPHSLAESWSAAIGEKESVAQIVTDLSALDSSQLPESLRSSCKRIELLVTGVFDFEGETLHALILVGCEGSLNRDNSVTSQEISRAGASLEPACDKVEVPKERALIDLLLVIDDSPSMAGEQDLVERLLREQIFLANRRCEVQGYCDLRVAVTTTESYLLAHPDRHSELDHDELLDRTSGLRGQGFVEDTTDLGRIVELAAQDPGCPIPDGAPASLEEGQNVCGSIMEDPPSSILEVARRLQHGPRAFAWRNGAERLAMVVTDEPFSLHDVTGMGLSHSSTREYGDRITDLANQLEDLGVTVQLWHYPESEGAMCDISAELEPIQGGQPIRDWDSRLAIGTGGSPRSLCGNLDVGLRKAPWKLTAKVEWAFLGWRLSVNGVEKPDGIQVSRERDLLIFDNRPLPLGAEVEVAYWRWVLE